MASKPNSILAKQDKGTVQVTFTLAWKDVEAVYNHVLQEEGAKVTIPGFRKGKAPIAKVKEKISTSVVIEHTLSHFYSSFIGEIINTHKVKPAIYPRIEVLKAIEGQDWEIRAVTCELPEFELGDYRKLILDKGKPQFTKEEKEQIILQTLVENIKIDIPALLIEEEVNNRLSQLLSRIEKLGLQIEGYLAQVGKTPETLRTEYETQAKKAISIELILGKIADTENVVANDQEVDRAIKAASAGQAGMEEKLNTPEQKNIVRNVLQRRTVMDSLVALI
ncbi:MAG: trigger factor [Patescibacteria group bacterium]